jgi:hypothetical protein
MGRTTSFYTVVFKASLFDISLKESLKLEKWTPETAQLAASLSQLDLSSLMAGLNMHLWDW